MPLLADDGPEPRIGDPLRLLVARIAVGVHHLLRRLWPATAQDAVDGVPAVERAQELDELEPLEVGEQEDPLEVGREMRLGVLACDLREKLPGAQVALGVIGHDGRGGAFGERLLAQREVVVEVLLGVEPEALILERVHELVGERQLEDLPPPPRLADHDQPLATVVVEAEHLLALDGLERSRDSLVLAQQTDEPQRLLVHALLVGRVLLVGPGAQHLCGSPAIDEQRADRPLELEPPQTLDAPRNPCDVGLGELRWRLADPLGRRLRRALVLAVEHHREGDQRRHRQEDSALETAQRSALCTAASSSATL